uniref:G-protein coupled receptors family 1 profile domain-containing protein n=1 Tax=Strongyloides stercoralis TaxID=6248 RepID=A0A0K0EC85_STRER
MNVVPGRCCRCMVDLTALIICVLLISIQSFILSHFFVKNFRNSIFYSVSIPDIILIITIIFATIAQIQKNQKYMRENYTRDGLLQNTWILWLTYSILLSLKIFTTFIYFYQNLIPQPLENYEKIFDDHLFKITIGLSIFIFVTLVEANHYTSLTSKRQISIDNIFSNRCLDILDTISIFDLLFENEKNIWKLSLFLQYFIVILVCINLILPSFSLLPMKYAKISEKFFCSTKIWGYFYIFLVNGPYITIRIYLLYLLKYKRIGEKYDISIFILKNILSIYVGTRNLWNGLQYWREKRIYSVIELHKSTKIIPMSNGESDDDLNSFES